MKRSSLLNIKNLDFIIIAAVKAANERWYEQY